MGGVSIYMNTQPEVLNNVWMNNVWMDRCGGEGVGCSELFFYDLICDNKVIIHTIWVIEIVY